MTVVQAINHHHHDSQKDDSLPNDLFTPVLDFLSFGDRLCLRVRASDPNLTRLCLDLRLIEYVVAGNDDKNNNNKDGGDKKHRCIINPFVHQLTTEFAQNRSITSLAVMESFLPCPSSSSCTTSGVSFGGIDATLARASRLLETIPSLAVLEHVHLDSVYLCVDMSQVTNTLLLRSSSSSSTSFPSQPSCWKSLRINLKVACQSQRDMDQFALALAGATTKQHGEDDELSVFCLGGLYFCPPVSSRRGGEGQGQRLQEQRQPHQHHRHHNQREEPSPVVIMLDPLLRVLQRMKGLREVLLGAWLSPYSANHEVDPEALRGLCRHLEHLQELCLIALNLDARHAAVLQQELQHRRQLQRLILVVSSDGGIGRSGLRAMVTLLERNAFITEFGYASVRDDDDDSDYDNIERNSGDDTAGSQLAPLRGETTLACRTKLQLLLRLNQAGRGLACCDHHRDGISNSNNDDNDERDYRRRGHAADDDKTNIVRLSSVNFLAKVSTEMDYEHDEAMLLTALWYTLRLHTDNFFGRIYRGRPHQHRTQW